MTHRGTAFSGESERLWRPFVFAPRDPRRLSGQIGDGAPIALDLFEPGGEIGFHPADPFGLGRR